MTMLTKRQQQVLTAMHGFEAASDSPSLTPYAGDNRGLLFTIDISTDVSFSTAYALEDAGFIGTCLEDDGVLVGWRLTEAGALLARLLRGEVTL